MAGYMTSAVVAANLDALAQHFPTLCTRSGSDWAPGWSGGSSGYLKVAAVLGDSPPARWAVLVTGGVHARELAPPDALVSFLVNLLRAYDAQSAITYPAWTDPVSKIVYDSFIISWPWVQRIVERLDLYVVPVVNDDGRDWVLKLMPADATWDTEWPHKWWRKNRRAAPAGSTDPRTAGVDINRNFDILWDYRKHYNMALGDKLVRSSDKPVRETFTGPAAESEPETQNVASLMRDKDISFYLDVHAIGRDVMYTWGTETDQTTDPTQNFTNAAWDGKRDGTQHDTYQEFIPASAAALGIVAAQRISDQIFVKAGGSSPAAQARSEYRVMQAAEMYVTTGTTQDFCFSRWFAPVTGGDPISPVLSVTLEVGGGDPKKPDWEGGFTPDYVKQYPKLEREIHVAAWAFLSMAAALPFQGPAAPPAPAPSGP
ncbi:MAG TPA: M14 family zinc carboxypeptidase [Trebonia sp.]|jgi:murein tripeptide amidase MpaA